MPESEPSAEASKAPLLAREHQLAQIQRWFGEAGAGDGRVALVLAPAGLGKTTLLREAAARAEDAGLGVLVARGRELERDMSFGVARQLFEGALLSLSGGDRASVLAGAAVTALPAIAVGDDQAAADRRGVIHGLYWLAANLADRRPLLLIVDDAHWADAQTLRWLAYVAPRIAEAPLLVLVAARPAEPGAENPLVETLATEESVSILELGPLDRTAVAQIIRGQHEGLVDGEFVTACERATGGNPFFLRELLRATVRDGIEPLATHASLVHQLTTAAVTRSILQRLARVAEPARRLAEAVAVLASDAEVRHVATLCGVPTEEALTLVDALVASDILREGRPLEFIHPIVRTAVYDQIAAGDRSVAHRRAAQLLADEGSASERVALHALACEPAADPVVVGWLREAARRARLGGASDAAARYLRRVLEEPPDRDVRPNVHFELGQALAGTDVAGAAASFANAAQSADMALRLLAHRWRGQALGWGGYVAAGVAAFEQASDLVVTDLELALLLGASRDFFALGWSEDPEGAGRSDRVQLRAADLEGATPGERRALATASLDIAVTATAPAARALELANRVRRALATWLDADAGVETAAGIGFSGIFCDDPEGLARHERVAAEATRRGMVVNAASVHAQTAHMRFRLGALLHAEADARTSWQLLGGERERAATFYWWSLANFVEILTVRGEVHEAAALVESTGLAAAPMERLWLVAPPPIPVVLGELALAQGRVQAGIELLMRGGAWLEERGFANPSLNPWRARVAPVLAMAGRRDEAREIIEPGLDRARLFGAPWALGMALCAAGVVEQGERGVELLHEAIAVLEPAGCRFEQANALLELGAMLRRANQRSSAREHLRAALDIAHRCGAVPLAARAREELAATGARPRRELLSGVESLTASERRVAQLAASGQSNPEIAQALFVTRKTVETHLGHVYSKLDIRSRQALAGAFARDERG